MNALHIDYLEWDDCNVEHIAEHGIDVKEVEWVCYAEQLVVRRAGVTRYGLPRYHAYGPTKGGRYWFIVLDREAAGHFYPVTAREMTDGERQRFRRARGQP
ncbi:MAG: hypothetical protein CVU38_01435 [Chloroflexi bacterium HGW-Chloroflexi-1]|nr:MAG: hypothetical protein CVU38_01435 [Chloroflexi bacterium HGW-Chloroflexi-1]